MKTRGLSSLLVLVCVVFIAGAIFFVNKPNGNVEVAISKTELLAPLDLKALEIKTASVNGVTIAYRMVGEGTPLLLVMGYGGTMDVWAPEMVAELAKTRRVIMFDNRGMGYSSATEDNFSIKMFAEDALALLTALNIEKADILGWSMGSLIAQEMALAQPAKTGKLVLYGTASNTVEVMKAIDVMGKMSVEEFMANLFPQEWIKSHPGVFKTLPVPGKVPDLVIMNRQKQALATWEGTDDRLDKIKNDVLLIVGDEDVVTLPEQSFGVAHRIKTSWLARFKGAGHWLMYQAPVDFARTVTMFLQTQESLI
ncbi:MAG: alpha/beta hydrolase [Alphaproteobacteria bacterium]|nr:alpha/beta hydrolase [Alphaproteobacteria bacterium]